MPYSINRLMIAPRDPNNLEDLGVGGAVSDFISWIIFLFYSLFLVLEKKALLFSCYFLESTTIGFSIPF